MTASFRLGLALSGALILSAAGALAQDYPTRTITIVVPFPPGGLTDVPARVFATMLQQRIGQNVVIENKTGGNGTIGAGFVARAAPDGYILLANSLADAQNVHFVAVPYSPIEDFVQIGWIVDGPPAVLVVNAALPYRTLADLIDDARKNPSTIGVAYVSRAAPDGYTLLANSLADAQNVHFVAVQYSPIDDFSQIGWIVDGPPAVLVVNAALPSARQGELAKLTGAALQK